MATPTGAPYAYGSDTRGGGKGPFFGLEKVGPQLIATSHGTAPWTSKVYQNTTNTPQKVYLQVHNLDTVYPAALDRPTKFTRLFIVAGDAVAVAAGSEILNIGLLGTETFWTAIPYVLYPSEILLALNQSGQPMTIYAWVETLV